MERYVRFVFTITLDKTSAVDAVTHLTDLLELFDHVVQNDGIGTALNLAALREMKAAGLRLAEVATGGDESHAPARRAYEKAGFTALPLVRYYQELEK